MVVRVTIIIPNYNRSVVVVDTISSLIKQSIKEWECIIVDDGSTDDSLSTISSIAKADDRIKLLSRDYLPKGAPTCRNIGMSNAKGEYIIFLDSDDILAPWCIETRVNYMEQNLNLDFAVFPILKFKNQAGDTNELWNAACLADDLEGFLKLDIPWQTTSPIWRKESLLNFGKWNEDLLSWQDWEFHIRAVVENLKYKKVAGLPDCFIRRDDGERISKKDSSLEQIINRKKLFREVYQYLEGKKNIEERYLRYIGRLYFIYAERIILRKLPYSAFEFYEDVKMHKMLPPFYYYISWLYLNMLQFFVNKNNSWGRRGVHKFFKLLFPKYFKSESTFLFKHKMSDRDFAELQQRIKFANGK